MEEVTKPQVVIIAGPNGAGKSTLAPVLLRNSIALPEYINADPIALGLSGFDPASVAIEAGRVMLTRIHELTNEGRSFAFESTLAARSYVRRIENLRGKGYQFHLIFLWLRSSELAVQRVRQRVRSGGHDVAEEIVRRRFTAGLKNFWTLYQPLADVWAVYDNSGSSTPVSVASGGRDKSLSVLAEETWTEFGRTKP